MCIGIGLAPDTKNALENNIIWIDSHEVKSENSVCRYVWQ